MPLMFISYFFVSKQEIIMPIMKSNIDILTTKEATSSSSLRTIILHYEKNNTYVWTNFEYHYDSNESLDAISQLFDESFQKLEKTTITFHNEEELPIVRYIGRWKITFIMKCHDGSINIVNGFPKPVDSYLGMENKQSS